MADHQPTKWEIFCNIFNENISFPVEIDPGATVGALKNAIKTKKQPEFDGFDAARLTLYLVNLPDDDSLAKNVKQQWPLKALRATQLVSALLPGIPATQELDVIPPGPQDGMVHIIVQHPIIGT
jgi:Crinkler effector protein N-terminal domain